MLHKSAPVKNPHMNLVVFQHGSHGAFGDFSTVIKELTARRKDMVVWGSDTCKGLGTDKGVGPVADIIAKELDDYLLPLLNDTRVQVCFVGHSMGGLVIRSLVTKAACFAHKHFEPVLYISIATPHLGIRQIGSFILAMAYIIGKVYCQTYLDLAQESETLSTLCNDTHITALRKFKKLVTVANLHDHLVSFGTSALLTKSCDPGLQQDPTCGKLRCPVRLMPATVPADEQIRASFSRYTDFGNYRANRVVQQFKTLRSLEWEMVAVDLFCRGNAAHSDIIAKGNSAHGEFSASRLSKIIDESFE